MSINLIGWTGWIAVVMIVVAALIMVVHVSRWVANRRVSLAHSRQLKALASSMFFVWTVGVLLYMFAMVSDKEGTYHPLQLLFHSFLCSLDMFAFQVDGDIFAALTQEGTDFPVLRAVISVTAVVASVLTILLLVSLVATRLWAYLRLFFTIVRATFSPRRRLFVFFGINEASKVLAEDIRKTQKEGDYDMIFVETPLANSDGEESGGIEGIMNLMTHRADTFRTAAANNALLSIANSSISDLDEADIAADGNVMGSIGVGLLARIVRNMRKAKHAEAHFFVLSDNDNDNLNKTAVLLRDVTIRASADAGVRTTFYCHARYNSINRVIEDEACGENIDVRIIDSSRISVEHMKQNVGLQPVSYVDVEKDGTVSSAFNALIVGFGEVGTDALRFLYEFSAFAATGSNEEVVSRSLFRCDVIDNRMDMLAGTFYANTPALIPDEGANSLAEGFPLQMGYEENRIVLHNIDARGIEYSSLVLERIKTLNYAVVATGDDTLNIDIAVRILRLAMRYSQCPQKLRIMVRINDRSKGNIDAVADHYNRLFRAQNGTETQRTEKPEGPITLFGDFTSIHTYDNIVSDKLLREARRYYDKYNNRYPPSKKEEWDERHKRLLGSRKGNKLSPSMAEIMELRRKESQDIANAKHAQTKLMLVRKAFEKAGEDGEQRLNGLRKAITEGTVTRQFGKITYHNFQHPILRTLAWTEHLRWCSSHEMLGYVYGKDRNEARMTHDNLVPWQQLTEEIQSYDCNVVDVTLENKQ